MVKTAKTNIMVNHIIFVLDKSGSMGHLRKVTVDNFNEQLGQLKIDAERNHVNLVSFVTFNSKVERVRECIPLGNFEEIKLEEYEPGGWTALYDGIGAAIMLADTGFEKYKDMDNSALIIILSDGMENRSCEYNQHKIAEIVKDRQDKGRFTFSFLGCGDHIVKQARGINIPWGNTTVWEPTADGMIGTMGVNSCATKSYMSARSAGHVATSGFYDKPFVPAFDVVHITGIDDLEDPTLFPQTTSGTPCCYSSGSNSPVRFGEDGILVPNV